VRIALAHPYTWPGVRRGGERYLADLAWWLQQAGHEVDVVTGSGRRLWRRAARGGLSPVDTFGLSAWAPLARGRHDVVHALVPSAALAARLAGRPTVYTHLGLPTAEHFGRRPQDRRLFTLAVQRSTAVTALSQAAADALRSLVPAQVRVLPPGVRREAFPADLRPRTGPPRLLFPADASDPRKGLATVLAALDLLLDRRPDARLLLAGPGDPSAALAAASERARAATDVAGVGELADLPGRYRAATVTVLPSRYEAFGLVLVESLASGTPAVATAEGGPVEILDDPLTGRTAAPADPASLAAALDAAVALAADPQTPGRCAEHARRYDWQVVGPAHEALYAHAARRGVGARRSPARGDSHQSLSGPVGGGDVDRAPDGHVAEAGRLRPVPQAGAVGVPPVHVVSCARNRAAGRRLQDSRRSTGSNRTSCPPGSSTPSTRSSARTGSRRCSSIAPRKARSTGPPRASGVRS
jgi:phosphatidylinositol alpha-mannosyltransferase